MLTAIYTPDIYVNLFKVRLNTIVDEKENKLTGAWVVDLLFQANPSYAVKGGQHLKAGEKDASLDASDQGRKAFYAPTISWGGTKNSFEAKNFAPVGETSFIGQHGVATIFYGTGDREHPQYSMIHNRVYAVYDDTALQAVDSNGNKKPLFDETKPYTEKELMNLTCDELGKDSKITSCYLGSTTLPNGRPCTDPDKDIKAYLRTLLYDDPTAPDGTLETVTSEDDAKGWYIELDKQGQREYRPHMEYGTLTLNAAEKHDADNHIGEQVLAKLTLFYGTLYYTTYQAASGSTCAPLGNGFTYAVRYEDGSANYDWKEANQKTITDRYYKYTGITGIPSGFTIGFQDGQVVAMANMGDQIVGAGKPNGPPVPHNGPSTPRGGVPGWEIDSLKRVDLYYWRDSNSQKENP